MEMVVRVSYIPADSGTFATLENLQKSLSQDMVLCCIIHDSGMGGVCMGVH